MLYQEKPKELKRLEVLCIMSDTTTKDIVKWVATHNPLDLVNYFSSGGLSGKELCVNGKGITDGYYLIRENGKYRLLDKDVFEDMYEPVTKCICDYVAENGRCTVELTKLTEFQKIQIISMILAVQKIANIENLNVEYITEQQLLDFHPLFEKYASTRTAEQIQSLTEIASLLHQDLTKG